MDASVWDVIWQTLVVFVGITVLIILGNVVIDVFRSPDLRAGAKAGWLIIVLLVPLLGMLAYVVVRGDGMPHRA